MTGQFIGRIVMLQAQAESLTAGGPYRPQPIRSVELGSVDAAGMLAWHDGGWLVDVHNRNHPAAKGAGRRALSVGFTYHYELMRERFGSVRPGVAGENIILESDKRWFEADLAPGLEIRTASGSIELRTPRVARPCVQFTSYLQGRPDVGTAEEVAADRAFLQDGMRGFIVDVDHLTRPQQITVGDEVWLAAGS